ncbi:MAG: hypothetical protein JWR80_801 [Bradyrhizobium sp.]|nr:hypothetical protein [Bradyrhizobium sp.]
MAKQVIVVVHGVGVKQAGVSSDLLAAALQDDDGKNEKTRLPPHSSDDFVLLESETYDSSGKASTFPARVRRYRSYHQDGTVDQERVIADFFWGDVTAFGSGVVDVVLAYFKVAMGLSHAIRENASDVYPEDKWEDRCIRRLARGAALTIHGPIIALNIVMLLGLLFAAGVASTFGSCMSADALLRVQIGGIGLLAIAAGLGLLSLGRGAFLYRHLLSWVVLSGLAFLILGSPELLGFADSKAVASIESWLVGFESGMSLEDFKHTYPGLLGVGWRMLALMSVLWFVVFFQAILVWILGLSRRKRVGIPPAPNLIVPALSLMSLLWLLLIAALWAAVLKLPSAYNLDLKKEAVAGALIAIGAAVIVLILLVVATARVFRLKAELKREKFSDPAAYMADSGANADAYANRYRLLMASWMLWALSIFLPLVLLTFALVPSSSYGNVAWIANTRHFLENWTITIIFGILAVGSALVYSFRAEFSAGIGILADVLAYLNNGSWMSGNTDDPYKSNEPPRQTWLEGLFFEKKSSLPFKASPRGYWLRRRIHDRLGVLIRDLIRDEKPDRLDIVSHSQGTMIAIDLIDIRGAQWLKGLPAGSGGIGLVTMGSPYTHLYGNYFPSSFQKVGDRPNLANRKDGGLLRDWLNIFRIDDFVGTHIGKGVWPREFPVHPNGHTNYWVDRGVVAKLREFLA